MQIRTLAYIAIGLHFIRKILGKVTHTGPSLFRYREGATHWVNVKLTTWEGVEKDYSRIASIPPGKLSNDEMRKILNRLNCGGWKEIFASWKGVIVSATFSISDLTPNSPGKDYITFRLMYGIQPLTRLRTAFNLHFHMD